jgi:hypothetical protein
MLHLLIALIRTVIASPLAAACAAWFGHLLTRLVARQLKVPEALVHDAGRYLYACVDTFERRLLRSMTGKVS